MFPPWVPVDSWALALEPQGSLCVHSWLLPLVSETFSSLEPGSFSHTPIGLLGTARDPQNNPGYKLLLVLGVYETLVFNK